jgi:hypothetical protein
MSDNEKMIKVQVAKSKCDVTAQKKLHSQKISEKFKINKQETI